jgi:hypothetical protein
MPDWMPSIPLAVCELRALPWLAIAASCAVSAWIWAVSPAATAADSAAESCETPPVYEATPELSWSRDAARCSAGPALN